MSADVRIAILSFISLHVAFCNYQFLLNTVYTLRGGEKSLGKSVDSDQRPQNVVSDQDLLSLPHIKQSLSTCDKLEFIKF